MRREEKARYEEQLRREEQARVAAEQAAAKKREQENVWATRVSYSPPAQENTNPWASIVSENCCGFRVHLDLTQFLVANCDIHLC